MNDLEQKSRALFERSVQQLDEATVRRLRLARRSALASSVAPAPRRLSWTAGLATAAVLALGLAWWLPRTTPASAPVAAVAPAGSASSGASVVVDAGPAEEPVLAEADEDADLYAWLGEAPVAADDAEQRL